MLGRLHTKLQSTSHPFIVAHEMREKPHATQRRQRRWRRQRRQRRRRPLPFL